MPTLRAEAGDILVNKFHKETNNVFVVSLSDFLSEHFQTCVVRTNKIWAQQDADQKNRTFRVSGLGPGQKQILEVFICGGNAIWPQSDPTTRRTLQVWAKLLP